MSTTFTAILPTVPSILSRWHPFWKLPGFLLSGVAVLLLQSVLIFGFLTPTLLALVLIPRVLRNWFLPRLLLLLVSLLPLVLLAPLTTPGADLLPEWPIRISEEGILLAGQVLGKAVCIFALVGLLLTSAPLPELLVAAGRMGVPGVLLRITLLAWNYLFIIQDELNRLRIAVKLRGYRNRANRHCRRTVGQLTGTLLVRGIERGERVAHAMRCRGFDGRFRSLRNLPVRFIDGLAFSGVVLLWLLVLGGDLWLRSRSG